MRIPASQALPEDERRLQMGQTEQSAWHACELLQDEFFFPLRVDSAARGSSENMREVIAE